jgi:hypothetical protein
MDHRDGCLDALVPEGPWARLDPLRADARRLATGASGAWDVAHRAATADGDLPELADADAEKLAGQVQDGRAQGAMRSAHRAVLVSAAAPCKQAAARFAGRSCAEAAAQALTAWSERPR